MEKKKFNKKEYNKQYDKEHYKTLSLYLDFDFYDEFMDAVTMSGKTKSEWLREAITEKLEQSE